MASLSTKLQISRILLSQGQSPKLSKHIPRNLTNHLPFCDPRSFWSWERKNKKKMKGDCQPTICGKVLPERLKPCNPQCASRCLRIKNCEDKELAMRKLSNCREPDKITAPKSYWEIIFGWKWQSKKLPDPRSCRALHREMKILRAKDPRLTDPRYEATEGDVLIFTESPREKMSVNREPRPKSPPAYKVPRAVFTQKFVKQASTTPHACAASWQFEASCDDKLPKCSGPKATILPFEELRPPERQRKMFSCKYGVQPEDVSTPLRRNSYSCETLKSETRKRATMSASDLTRKNDSTELSLDISGTRGKSRMEQLKKLTRAKGGSRCCELFSTTTSKKSSCSSRCKMSTFTHCLEDSSWRNIVEETRKRQRSDTTLEVKI